MNVITKKIDDWIEFYIFIKKKTQYNLKQT